MNLFLLFLPISIVAAQYLFLGSDKITECKVEYCG